MHEPFLNPSPYPDTHVPSTYIHSPLHTNIRNIRNIPFDPNKRRMGGSEGGRRRKNENNGKGGREDGGRMGRDGRKKNGKWGGREGGKGKGEKGDGDRRERREELGGREEGAEREEWGREGGKERREWRKGEGREKDRKGEEEDASNDSHDNKCFCDIEFRIRLPAIMYVPFFIPNYYHVSVRAWEIFSAGAHYLNDITPPPSYKKKLLMPFSAIIILWLTFGALVHLGFTLHLASGDRVAAGCIVAGRLACGVAVVCGVGGCVYGKGWLVVAEVVV